MASSLIWGAKANAALFRGLGVTGIANRELTPDFATKLGAAYGAFLKKGANVVSRGTATGVAHAQARHSRRAVSVGCNVLDLEAMPCRSRALPSARMRRRAA